MIIKLLDSKKDRNILERIYKYEESIFEEAAVGKYNISPFTKYGRTYAIYDDENIVCVIETLYSLDRVAYLYGVSTNESFRHKGYATQLITYITQDLKKYNIKRLELTVEVKNDIAIEMYKKLGFSIKELLENEYFDNNKRYLMFKEI